MSRTLPALLLAVALVAGLIVWEPDDHVETGLDARLNLVPERIISSSRGARPPESLSVRAWTQPTATPTISSTPAIRLLGVFRVTSYSSCDPGMRCDGITFSGQAVRWGVVAVDPDVVKLGSRLLIEGFGPQVFTALDTGSAVVGRHVDIWRADRRDALTWGVRYKLVYLVNQ